MDRQLIFGVVFVKSPYLEIEDMFATGKKKWGKTSKETREVTCLKES